MVALCNAQGFVQQGNEERRHQPSSDCPKKDGGPQVWAGPAALGEEMGTGQTQGKWEQVEVGMGICVPTPLLHLQLNLAQRSF